MLSATALVLLMTIPGPALFYAGMVRKKNVLSTALQSFFVCALVTVLWVLIGYSLAFTPGSPLLGACSGAVAGLVAITPASGFVDVEGALGADDSLDVFGIHGVGALLTGATGDRRS